MGYYMEQINNKFMIKEENVQKTWDALVELFKKAKANNHRFGWCISDEVINAETFGDAMYAVRWDILEGGTGNVYGIRFAGEKYSGDEEIIFGSIAPYVEDGSYITMQGEDGERWKWKFINGKVEEIYGHWVFDDER